MSAEIVHVFIDTFITKTLKKNIYCTLYFMFTIESPSRIRIGPRENQIMQETKTVYTFGGTHTNGMTKVVIGITLTYVNNLKVRKSCANYIDNI